MSLYYDAAAVLDSGSQDGSLKSRIYSNASTTKSKPAHIFALISECAKYDIFIKEVIDNAGLLEQEAKLTPILSLFLVHDHFFSKGGIATSSNHVLRQSIERHKARLQAEFTKARLRRKCGTIDALKKLLVAERLGNGGRRLQPRWVRINRLKSSTEEQLRTTFAGYEVLQDLLEVGQSEPKTKVLYIDHTVPDLLALPPDASFVQSSAYGNGEIILQDKASCFPAYLLIDDSPSSGLDVGDIIDGCAAPGNKTTHVASIVSSQLYEQSKRSQRKVFACERDPVRSRTLQSMVGKAAAKDVVVLAKQDFLALDPHDQRFTNVTYLLLDPSCSGSGIVGREDVPAFALPHDPKGKKDYAGEKSNSKKRKRDPTPINKKDVGVGREEFAPLPNSNSDVEEMPDRTGPADPTRLAKLANLQSRILEHALTFPHAIRVSYSTCSIHTEENEAVVSQVLNSQSATDRSWRLLRRHEQVAGMRSWKHRGINNNSKQTGSGGNGELSLLSEEDLEACIRCYPGDEEGTMGFFVCCFVRDSTTPPRDVGGTAEVEGDEWEGFSDGD